MADVKTIIINGASYTVEDPEAVHYTRQTLTDEQKAQARENIGAACIDDAKSGKDAWSAKHTVDTLCPDFSGSGSAVSCDPVEGSALAVVSEIAYVQEGSGDPSPDTWEVYTTITGAGQTQLDITQEMRGCTFRVYDSVSGEPPAVYNPGYTATIGTVNGKYTEFTIPAEDDADSGWIQVFVEHYDQSVSEAEYVVEKRIPGNVRPITGWEKINLTLENGVDKIALFNVQFHQAVGTVYGGSFDWQTGVLTVDSAVKTIAKAAGFSSSGFPYVLITDAATPGTTYVSCCNRLKKGYISTSGAPVAGRYTYIANGNSGVIVRFTLPDCNDLEAVNAWLAENPLQFLYKLKEPKVIQLSTQEILAISGTNYIFSDTGDTEVTGKADPKTVIRNQQAAITALAERVAALEAAAVKVQEVENDV